MKYQSSILSQKEIRRYAFPISVPEIGIQGQEKIKTSRVLVIGAGGKGTSVLQNLASLGIGGIGISDNYPVLERDLSRQHLYGGNDIGKQKAIISRQRLLDINDLNEYKLHNVYLTEHNVSGICESYDVLIDATDREEAHYLINDAAIKLNKPVILGMVEKGIGKISVLNYQQGPSFRCLDSNPKNKDKPYQQKDFSCHLSLLGIIGSIITNETVKVILGKESDLSGRLLCINLATYSFDQIEIKKNPNNFQL